jgi:hypothetical protein
MPQARKQKKRLEPPPKPDAVEIVVGWQGDQGVYQVEPLSEDLIRETYPEAHVLPTLVLGSDSEDKILDRHRPLWPQVATMLTGLTPAQLRQLGGVRLVDSWPYKILWEWKPEAASNQ